MKYIRIPKIKNVLIFSILVIMSVCLNLISFFMRKSFIAYNSEVFLIIHIVLPIAYNTIFCMLISYLIYALEDVFSNFKNDLQLKLLNILGVVEIFVGIFLVLVVYKNEEGYLNENRQNTIKYLTEITGIKSLITDADIINDLTYLIYMMYLYLLIACSIIMLFAVVRQFKTKKRIKMQEKELRLKTELNQFLGFDYEKCDFYKQVEIPYYSLQQSDGTYGEFEVYRMLRKCGLTDVMYIFNREIPKIDGLTTQLDLIVIHNKGIFVIENKHYSTRVFGNGLDRDLTIIDHCGNKKSIYNPIWQNERHVIVLKDYLNSKKLYIDEELTPVYSIVVFTAETGDQTDNIISGISTEGVKTKVCTSQNVGYIISQLISTSSQKANVNVFEINKVLSELPVRKNTQNPLDL